MKLECFLHRNRNITPLKRLSQVIKRHQKYLVYGKDYLLFSIITLMLILPTSLTAQNKIHREAEAKMKAIALQKAMEGNYDLTKWQKIYDVNYYELDIEIIENEEKIRGGVEMRFTSLSDTLSKIELDLYHNMVVESVSSGDTTLSYTRNGDKLFVHLGKIVPTNNTSELLVRYSGKPQSAGFGSFMFSSHNEQALIWTLSEPYGARAWWPCKDHPSDKADSVQIAITAPKELLVVSNGSLISKKNVGEISKTIWKERYPISTYLVSLAIHPYYQYTDTYKAMDSSSVPIEFYIYDDLKNNSSLRKNFALTKNMMTAFAGYFGEYPFVKEKYGHAMFGWGGGMEHQTCSSMGGWSEGLIAHELAHQWFGDLITCYDFRHIWLNEGFATYSEALWQEYAYGKEAYHAEMDYSDDYRDGGSIYVTNPTNTSVIFHGGLSYNKASFVLHMLRHVVGDDTFFEILKAYNSDERYAFNVATTENFQKVCEDVSGMELDYFFRQWIYGEYFPDYLYGWKVEPEGAVYRFYLDIKQIQKNTGIFSMPIDIHINYQDGSDSVLVIRNSKAYETYEVIVPKNVKSIQFDPENWIFKSVEKVEWAKINSGASFVPLAFSINAIYPNPFNPRTSIDIYLPDPDDITLTVYDVIGRKVEVIVDDMFYGKGFSEINWEPKQLASGIYYILLTGKKRVDRKRVVFLK
jgi:aminopeptidase N